MNKKYSTDEFELAPTTTATWLPNSFLIIKQQQHQHQQWLLLPLGFAFLLQYFSPFRQFIHHYITRHMKFHASTFQRPNSQPRRNVHVEGQTNLHFLRAAAALTNSQAFLNLFRQNNVCTLDDDSNLVWFARPLRKRWVFSVSYCFLLEMKASTTTIVHNCHSRIRILNPQCQAVVRQSITLAMYNNTFYAEFGIFGLGEHNRKSRYEHDNKEDNESQDANAVKVAT